MKQENYNAASAYRYYIRKDNESYTDAMNRGNYGAAMVAAQQSAEKSLKGVLQAVGDLQKKPRISHDLWKLYRRCCFCGYIAKDIRKADLQFISDAYFAARYPRKSQEAPTSYYYDDADMAGAIADDFHELYLTALGDARARESGNYDPKD